MTRTKKYVARISVSKGVMQREHPRRTQGTNYTRRRDRLVTNSDLQALLDRVRQGDLDPSAAAATILTAMRAAPFEDLGFARVDTHRQLRQGFPEVILGLGKTPTQIAAIAEKIVARGQTLLVT